MDSKGLNKKELNRRKRGGEVSVLLAATYCRKDH